MRPLRAIYSGIIFVSQRNAFTKSNFGITIWLPWGILIKVKSLLEKCNFLNPSYQAMMNNLLPWILLVEGFLTLLNFSKSKSKLVWPPFVSVNSGSRRKVHMVWLPTLDPDSVFSLNFQFVCLFQASKVMSFKVKGLKFHFWALTQK